MIWIVVAVEKQQHVRLVLVQRLVEVEHMVEGLVGGHSRVHHLDLDVEARCAHPRVQVAFEEKGDRLIVRERRVERVRASALDTDAVEGRAAQHENPEDAGGLGHVDQAVTAEALRGMDQPAARIEIASVAGVELVAADRRVQMALRAVAEFIVVGFYHHERRGFEQQCQACDVEASDQPSPRAALCAHRSSRPLCCDNDRVSSSGLLRRQAQRREVGLR